MKTCHTVLLVGGLLSAAVAGCKRTAVDLEVLRAIPVGASTQSVTKLLGPPTQVWPDGRTWSYYSSNVSHKVYVKFDTNLLYKGYQFDR